MAFGLETHRGSPQNTFKQNIPVFLGAENDISLFFLASCLLYIILFSLYFCPCIAHCLSVAAQKHAVDAKGLPLQSEPTYLNWEHATHNASNN